MILEEECDTLILRLVTVMLIITYHKIKNLKGKQVKGVWVAKLGQICLSYYTTTFTEKKLNVRYLKPLNYFISSYRTLQIFSTNYDICVETFCEENNKKYFDGFTPSWDPDEFHKRDVHLFLYKLHGSVRWYRTEQGDYEASRLIFTSTRVNLDTRQEENSSYSISWKKISIY
ncbi:MAG: SIR2 family protein [Candidatus Nitrosopolaris sp.]